MKSAIQKYSIFVLMRELHALLSVLQKSAVNVPLVIRLTTWLRYVFVMVRQYEVYS